MDNTSNTDTNSTSHDQSGQCLCTYHIHWIQQTTHNWYTCDVIRKAMLWQLCNECYHTTANTNTCWLVNNYGRYTNSLSSSCFYSIQTSHNRLDRTALGRWRYICLHSFWSHLVQSWSWALLTSTSNQFNFVTKCIKHVNYKQHSLECSTVCSRDMNTNPLKTNSSNCYTMS